MVGKILCVLCARILHNLNFIKRTKALEDISTTYFRNI